VIANAFVAASNETFRVVEYSVQANHVHFLVEASDERALSRNMNGLTTRIARGLNVEALIRRARVQSLPCAVV